VKNVLGFLSIVLFSAFSLLAATSFALPGPKITENGNKHNLSYYNSGANLNYLASDPNDPRARQICIFCHTPHNAVSSRSLWNRRDTNQTFGHYSSPNLHIANELKADSNYNEPNGSSRLCLSCHDGVTALGAVVRGPQSSGTNISINGSPDTINTINVFDRVKVTNNHHPVSFNYAGKVYEALIVDGYKLPPPGGKVKLDRDGRMQCTTCHDPHQTKDTAQPFWVLEDTGGIPSSHDAVCLTCHNAYLPKF
jgi:hypothetical protein